MGHGARVRRRERRNDNPNVQVRRTVHNYLANGYEPQTAMILAGRDHDLCYSAVVQTVYDKNFDPSLGVCALDEEGR